MHASLEIKRTRIPTHDDTASAPTPEDILAQMNCLQKRAFAGSYKLFAFLRFVVDEALQGRAHSLKELVIGDALYGGVQVYDPRIDSAVRVEARRLRRKLEDYYATIGCEDEVLITMPTGGYAPRFALRIAAQRRRPRWKLEPTGANLPLLAVLPFTSLSGHAQETAFAAGLTEELITAAKRQLSYRLVPRAVVYQYRERSFSMAEVAAETNSDFILHGAIRRADNFRRVSLELADRTGQIFWSNKIDVERGSNVAAQERAASAIVRSVNDRSAVMGEHRDGLQL